MTYLQRLAVRPNIEELTASEARHVRAHFDPHASEVLIDRQPIPWSQIDEVEVAPAARMKSPAGWLVKKLVMGGERYHVGVYMGQNEAVLTNLTLNAVRHVVQTIAFYVPKRVSYTGPADLDITPLIEV